MQKLVWQNSLGDEVDLTKAPYGITNWEGFSNTSLNIQSQQVPFQDGGVFLDALMEQRELSVTLAIQDNNNLEKRYQYRRELIHILNPKLGEGYLIYTNDFISKRIKCVAQIPLFETHNSNDSGTPKASLAWTACEPYWEDLEETTIQFDVGTTAVLNNNGDIPAQVEIFLNGNSTNSRITNKTTGKFIEYDSLLTEQLHINTNIGKKSVTVNEKLDYEAVEWRGNITSVRFISEYERFYGTSQEGEIISSYDGVSWEVKQETKRKLYDVAYSGRFGLFVAIGSGVILTSTDGENWEEDEIGIGDDYHTEKIIWVDDLRIFVLICGEYIYTSSDGVTYTQKAFVEGRDLVSVTYSKKLGMIAVVGSIAIVTSTDGETWNTTEITGNGFQDIVYSEQQELFVVVGADIYTSSDGVNWTNVYSFTYDYGKGIVYNKTISQYIIFTDNGVIYTTSDLTNLIQVKSVDSSITMLRCISYSFELNIICIGCDYGISFASNNGQNWRDNISSIGTNNFEGVAFGNDNICVAVGRIIARSIDGGQSWTKVSDEEKRLYDVIFVDGMFVAVGYGGVIKISYDGLLWSTYSSGYSEGILYAITYNRGMFIAVGKRPENESGDIFTSTDGITWTRRSIIGDCGRLYGVVCGSDLCIAVGDGKSIAVSTDGITWTSLELFTGEGDFTGIAINELTHNYVLVGEGYIGISENGTDWDLREVEWNFTNIYYNGVRNGLILLTESGEIFTSEDGITLNEIDITAVSLNGMASDYLGNLVFVGSVGTIIRVSMLNTGVRNMIQYLSKDSDMNFNLIIGNNKLFLSRTSGTFSAIVKYRQKYIGV